ncbi:MAG: ACT domain-containing protein, partial [Spirochaetaceae bacterium]
EAAGGPSARTTGVAGRTGFRTVLIERSMLSKEAGYLDRVRHAFTDAAVPLRHAVSGSDSVLVVCPAEPLEAGESGLRQVLTEKLGAENVDVGGPMAIVGVVCPSRGVHAGVLARVSAELERSDLRLRYVSAGESPHTIVFGVDEGNYADAVRAVYRAARAE